MSQGGSHNLKIPFLHKVHHCYRLSLFWSATSTQVSYALAGKKCFQKCLPFLRQSREVAIDIIDPYKHCLFNMISRNRKYFNSQK